jgi:hypothetical protein
LKQKVVGMLEEVRDMWRKTWTWTALASALAVAAAGLLPLLAHGDHADPPANNAKDNDEEVLTSGVVHEAFGKPVAFDPQPGIIIAKKPPEPIEELPPEEKPVGDNVAWIHGYWGWDADRGRFIWVSGFYRSLPPDREWVPGYWYELPEGKGYQWVSGFWKSTAVKGVEYLPPPPESLEIGPTIAAPGEDYFWSSGCWVYYERRYVWRPGCWVRYRPGWVYVPAHYVWTPCGYVYIHDYWDYSIRRRGLLLAPVYIDPVVYCRPQYVFRPRIIIDLDLLTDHFFCYPRYYHYCFGDYYSRDYLRIGIYPWFSFHLSCGYSASYAYYDCFYRKKDPKWSERIREQYVVYREDASTRPPRTFAAQQALVQEKAKKPGASVDHLLLVKPVAELAAAKDAPIKIERIEAKRRDEFRERSREVRDLASLRLKREQETAAKKPAEIPKLPTPVAVELPRSPIVGKPAKDFDKADAPPPPPAVRIDPDIRPAKPPERPRPEDRIDPKPPPRLVEPPKPVERPKDPPKPVEQPKPPPKPVEQPKPPPRLVEPPKPVEQPKPPPRLVDPPKPVEQPKPPPRPSDQGRPPANPPKGGRK